MKLHVFAHLVKIAIVFVNFDLWLSRGCGDTFSLKIIYLNDYWNLMHVIVDLFEAHETA
jgi:hypothetical protein